MAEKKYMVWGYLAVGIAIVVAVLLAEKDKVEIGISEGFAPFAVIYIVAQAIERFIQPFTNVTAKAKEKTQAKSALAEAKGTRALALVGNRIDTAVTEERKVVDEQKKLETIQADRALVFWALATVLSLLICGLLELGLIQSIAKVTGTDGDIPGWFTDVDVVLTGIAIGSGTKPLHDLIAFIQNTKQKTEPATGQG